MKFCTKCQTEKLLDDFHNHSGRRDGRQPWCKECQCAAVARNREERRRANGEKLERPASKRCPDCGETLDSSLFYNRPDQPGGLSSYCMACTAIRNAIGRGDPYLINGRPLTGTEYRAFFAANPVCMRTGCLRESAVLDHDHSTGEVRGVLCGACNLSAGQLDDDIWGVAGLVLYMAGGNIDLAYEAIEFVAGGEL